MPDVPMAKLGSASYTANLNSRVVLTLSAYKDFPIEFEGVFLGLSLMLGERTQAGVSVGQTERVTVSMPLGRSQSVALSYIGYRMPDVPMAKLGSASYTANLNSRVVLTLSAYKDF
ncbi:hypothetical protein CTI14_53730, partial [Methylobacterium radiotolerans]